MKPQQVVAVALALPIALCSLVACRSLTIVPGRSVVLPESLAFDVLKQCSRPTPLHFVTDTWSPSEDDIRDLESHFPRLSRMRAVLPCCLGCRVDDINQFYRQYVGVVINGRRLIYVNALHVSTAPSVADAGLGVCDGGDYYWGVLYDPESGTFRELAFNMEA